MEELEQELQKQFTKALIGITDEQIGLIPDILKGCYRMVLIGTAFGTMDERFGMFFNALQDLLKEFSGEAYSKAFTLGNDLFMKRMKEK